MENLHQDKFIDQMISFRQTLDLDPKTITALNLLTIMRRGRSEDYATRAQYAMALTEAYDARILNNLSGLGAQVLLESRFQFIRSDLIDEAGYTERIIRLMDQALFHPRLDETTLEEARMLLHNRLRSMKEDSDSLAIQEALKRAQKDHPIAIPMQGYEEEIDSVTLEQIQNLWQKILKEPMQILSVSTPDRKIEEYIAGINQGTCIRKPETLIQAQPVEERVISRRLSQSALAQIYATHIEPDSPLYYHLLVMNSLLGQGPVSLLFEEIREKHSLCYSISSTLIRYDGALCIVTGTSRENIPQVTELIAKQIKRLITGDFSDQRLEASKLDLIDALEGQEDSLLGLISQQFANDFLKRKEGRREIIEKVAATTKEDVMRIAGNLELVSQAQVLEKEIEVQQEDKE